MIIDKRLVLAELEKRGLQMRAQFVDKQLPDEIDTRQHGGLLSTLHLDLEALAAATASKQTADGETA